MLPPLLHKPTCARAMQRAQKGQPMVPIPIRRQGFAPLEVITICPEPIYALGPQMDV